MELPFAFIDARTVISVEQISSAIYKALVESTYNRMRTKTLHSECILSLSPSSNIGDALKRFGIKEDSTNLIVIKIVKNGDDEPFDGKTSIVGDLVPVSDEQFVTTADIETIKNNYKLNLDKLKDVSNKELSALVVDAIQLRGL